MNEYIVCDVNDQKGYSRDEKEKNTSNISKLNFKINLHCIIYLSHNYTTSILYPKTWNSISLSYCSLFSFLLSLGGLQRTPSPPSQEAGVKVLVFVGFRNWGGPLDVIELVDCTRDYRSKSIPGMNTVGNSSHFRHVIRQACICTHNLIIFYYIH